MLHLCMTLGVGMVVDVCVCAGNIDVGVNGSDGECGGIRSVVGDLRMGALH